MNLRKLLGIVLFVLLLTSCNTKEESQINAINLDEKIKSNFEGTRIGLDAFYLLGWSDDARKFAYAVQKETNMEAMFSAKIYIQETENNHQSWKVSLEDVTMKEYENFEHYWSSNHSYIEFVLKQNKIKLLNKTQIKSFPMVYNHVQLNVRLELKKHNLESSNKDFFAGLGGYKLFLTTPASKVTLLTDCELEVQESDCGWDTTSKIKVLGYFESPKKSHIAILIARLEYGFEGVKTIRYDVVGADLDIVKKG